VAYDIVSQLQKRRFEALQANACRCTTQKGDFPTGNGKPPYFVLYSIRIYRTTKKRSYPPCRAVPCHAIKIVVHFVHHVKPFL
jgi:hypothetical protein